jgi:preprotein translocase subunit YajC
MKEMQATIGKDDNVITNSGLFGRVVDVGEDCFIVEFGTNRGIRIPVLKSEVAGIRDPKMTPPPKAAE